MSLAFVGFKRNGESCLSALVEAGLPPALVATPADESGAMHELADRCGAEFLVADRLPPLEEKLAEVRPELLLVASFPRLFPAELLRIPERGVLNVHTAALPRWRGMHPVNWALIHGDREVGVTVHFMDEGMDSGDIVAQERVPVGIEDDVNSLVEKLTAKGAELLVRATRDVLEGRAERRPQRREEATFAPRRRPADSRLDWAHPSCEVRDFCRALYAPYPNAYSFVEGGGDAPVRVEKVHLCAAPGTILARAGERDYVVATADGTVFVRLDRADLAAGDRLV